MRILLSSSKWHTRTRTGISVFVYISIKSYGTICIKTEIFTANIRIWLNSLSRGFVYIFTAIWFKGGKFSFNFAVVSMTFIKMWYAISSFSVGFSHRTLCVLILSSLCLDWVTAPFLSLEKMHTKTHTHTQSIFNTIAIAFKLHDCLFDCFVDLFAKVWFLFAFILSIFLSPAAADSFGLFVCLFILKSFICTFTMPVEC